MNDVMSCPRLARTQVSVEANQNETKIMNHKFDELTKSLAQSVTRRAALKKFGIGLVGIVLGLPNKSAADANAIHCQCKKPNWGCDPSKLNYYACTQKCSTECSI